MRVRRLSTVPGTRTRGHGHKLEHRRFPLNIRSPSAPRGCGVSSLGISQSCLDVAPGTLLWVPLLGQGLSQMAAEILSNLKHSVIP